MMQRLTLPREKNRPALAYRATRQAGDDHHAAHDAAVVTFRQVLPEMPEKRAVQEVIEAIAYATREHTAWFWKGVGR